MRAVDTNVLVRLITQDDATQLTAAEDFVATGAWVSLLALAEAMWVLASIYDRGPRQIAATLRTLLDNEHLILQDSDVVASALTRYEARPALKFSDCLLVEIARKAGHLPLGTFDRDLGKVEGAERLR